MTAELLRHLRSVTAFDHHPVWADLGSLHVPFDALVGGSAVEGRLGEAVQRYGRVALIGPSGCGKSSVTSYGLGPLVPGVAPILVPITVFPADDPVEPLAVANRLIATIARQAGETAAVTKRTAERARLSAADTQAITRGRQVRASLRGGPHWLGGELAADLTRQAAGEVPVGPEEKREVISLLLRRIAGEDLVPVLVFDDTDRWIGGTGFEDDEASRAQ